VRNTFFKLAVEKRERLLDICAREFRENGYELASTNTIVRESEISKGSFFKYFDAKESVFLYLAERVLRDLGEMQGPRAAYGSADIVARAGELFARHMEYARRSPLRYDFILRALLDTNSSMYPKIVSLRDRVSESTGGYLYEGVDWSLYRYPKAEVIEFLRCLDLGLRQAAMESLGKNTDLGMFEAYVSERLALAGRILASGLYETSSTKEE
jgi:TetR/AcrR family transcriptional regulator